MRCCPVRSYWMLVLRGGWAGAPGRALTLGKVVTSGSRRCGAYGNDDTGSQRFTTDTARVCDYKQTVQTVRTEG
jgi:hypothetical protein